MKNHELVPGPLVAQIANVRAGGVHKMLQELSKHRLCSYERGKHCKCPSSSIPLRFFLSSICILHCFIPVHHPYMALSLYKYIASLFITVIILTNYNKLQMAMIVTYIG